MTFDATNRLVAEAAKPKPKPRKGDTRSPPFSVRMEAESPKGSPAETKASPPEARSSKESPAEATTTNASLSEAPTRDSQAQARS